MLVISTLGLGEGRTQAGSCLGKLRARSCSLRSPTSKSSWTCKLGKHREEANVLGFPFWAILMHQPGPPKLPTMASRCRKTHCRGSEGDGMAQEHLRKGPEPGSEGLKPFRYLLHPEGSKLPVVKPPAAGGGKKWNNKKKKKKKAATSCAEPQHFGWGQKAARGSARGA